MWKTGPYLTIGGDYTWNDISLPADDGDFTTRLAGVTILGAVSRSLFANALVQYDDVSNVARANVRINWIHTPGSDLFLGLRHGVPDGRPAGPAYRALAAPDGGGEGDVPEGVLAVRSRCHSFRVAQWTESPRHSSGDAGIRFAPHPQRRLAPFVCGASSGDCRGPRRSGASPLLPPGTIPLLSCKKCIGCTLGYSWPRAWRFPTRPREGNSGGPGSRRDGAQQPRVGHASQVRKVV